MKTIAKLITVVIVGLFTFSSLAAAELDNDQPKKYMLLFRSENIDHYKLTPEQIQESIKQWQTWIGGIAAQGKLVSTHQIGSEAAVLLPNDKVEKKPYEALNQIVGGYMILKASSMKEAMEFAKECPVFQIGGNVEIRDIMEVPENN
ncbi:YciI family protein [Aquimarina sp. D1M17]|uniref:YciI family protein n=1 Tax=Aquimarina acroporae TaxID=2937283 RepID=UPI0020BD9253|nr:YciI family protein [Aquimarina acroporae]MCK8522358.1 YciI family protein [Aquimarina acroporae]